MPLRTAGEKRNASGSTPLGSHTTFSMPGNSHAPAASEQTTPTVISRHSRPLSSRCARRYLQLLLWQCAMRTGTPARLAAWISKNIVPLLPWTCTASYPPERIRPVR